MDNTTSQPVSAKKKAIAIVALLIIAIGVTAFLIWYKNHIAIQKSITEREQMAQILNKNATTPTTQERIDIAKQLNQINKPVVSAKTTTGTKTATSPVYNTQTLQDRTSAALLLNQTH